MAAVMMEAASYVEKEETHLEEIITRLKTENQVIFMGNSLHHIHYSVLHVQFFQGLRELLAISKQFGSVDAVKENASETQHNAS